MEGITVKYHRRFAPQSLTSMWKLALRNVFRHKTRTALTLAAIVFGVVALIMSGGFVQDFLIQLREATIHSQFGHLQVYRAGYYQLGRRSPYQYMIDEPDKIIADLSRLDQVVDITPRVNFSGLLSNGRTTFPIVGEGVDPERELPLSTYITMISGNNLPKNDPYNIIVGQGVANALNLKIGSNVILLISTREGAINTFDFKVAGVFHTFSKEYDDRAIRIPIAAAQELLATKAVHSLVFALRETERTDAVAQQVRNILPKEYEIKTWYELADFYQKAVELYERYFLVLNLIILGLVALSVANSVNMTLYERTGEFGTLMALGNHGTDVFKLIISECLILGLIGSATGILLGVVFALAISAVGIPMPPLPNTNSGYTAVIQILPWELVKAFAIGFCATLGSALLPARRASKLEVVDALRSN
jgi:putative ABC transport system permease protein